MIRALLREAMRPLFWLQVALLFGAVIGAGLVLSEMLEALRHAA